MDIIAMNRLTPLKIQAEDSALARIDYGSYL